MKKNEVGDAISELKKKRIEKNARESEFDEQVLQIQQAKTAALKELVESIEGLEAGLIKFAKKNLKTIRAEGQKSAIYPDGVIKTKETKTVTYPENLLKRLQNNELTEFIETVKKPMKNAIKARYKVEPGIYKLLGIKTSTETNISIVTK
ncbi:MAG: hypothetical protein GY757_37905 [bacterium]|nr:hypothetical protein [bacterium]